MKISKFFRGIFDEFIWPAIIYIGAFSSFLLVCYVIGAICLFFGLDPEPNVKIFGSTALSNGMLFVSIFSIFVGMVYAISFMVFEFIKTMKKIIKNSKDSNNE